MLKHIVMYKLKNPTEAQKKALVEVFMSMKGKIEMLLDVESGADTLYSERSFDVALVCTFESLDMLKLYSEHPVHQKVREYVKTVAEKSHTVDYNF